VPATVVDAVKHPLPCLCACYTTLTLDERAAGIGALYRFDDAMRGWGQTVIWDLAAPALWRIQQKIGANAKWVVVRENGCLYSRLLGFCTHELIHALCGDATAPNYGTPVGLPYSVPVDVPVSEEATYLHKFNEYEARAFTGIPAVAFRLFAIEWPLRAARDVGTYGFPGGSALCEQREGYRRVAHYDDKHHQHRYYALARKLEDEARAWFTPERLDDFAQRFEEAERRGRASRPCEFPAPREIARISPRKPGRNDLCLCGSMQKWKQCCGAAVD
jgi:hypothetical protein